MFHLFRESSMNPSIGTVAIASQIITPYYLHFKLSFTLNEHIMKSHVTFGDARNFIGYSPSSGHLSSSA